MLVSNSVPYSSKLAATANAASSTLECASSDTGEDVELVHGDLPVPWSPLAHNRSLYCSDLPSGAVAPERILSAPRNFQVTRFRGSACRASWTDRYFEGQTLAYCGMHALDNLVGGPQFTPPDMATACSQVVAETCDLPSVHATTTGWYSHSLLGRVLQNTIPARWRLRLHPLLPAELESFCEDPLICGALMNEDNTHWLAIAKHGGSLWHVDSKHTPRPISLTELLLTLRRYPATFPLLEVAPTD